MLYLFAVFLFFGNYKVSSKSYIMGQWIWIELNGHFQGNLTHYFLLRWGVNSQVVPTIFFFLYLGPAGVACRTLWPLLILLFSLYDTYYQTLCTECWSILMIIIITQNLKLLNRNMVIKLYLTFCFRLDISIKLLH